MRKVEYSGRFLKDYKRLKKRKWDVAKLENLVKLLANDGELPFSARPHKLSGEYTGMWDAHVTSDWVLIYKIGEDYLTLRRTGTHSDVFK